MVTRLKDAVYNRSKDGDGTTLGYGDDCGRFFANEDFWEGGWSVFARSLVAVESDS